MTPEAAAAPLIRLALAEDLGTTGDRTTLALIPSDAVATAVFVARSGGVIAGLKVAAAVLKEVDPNLKFTPVVTDGTATTPGQTVATVHGKLQSILITERTALNFLQRLSGVATLTRKYVDAVAGTKAKVLDTRKTTPGWRVLEKYAVACGGGTNHRVGLYDAILIKDNHIAGLGDPTSAVRRSVELARAFPGNAGLPVEVEVDSLEQLRQVLPSHPEIVLLDNMGPPLLKQAVTLRNDLAPGTLLEASGGVTLTTIRGIAEAGVDRISVGALTHSAPTLDIALDYAK